MPIDRSFKSTWADDSGSNEDGTVIDEADFDALLDAIDDLTENRATVYNDAAQSLPNDTATAVTFNQEEADSNGLHSTSSNTSRITIPSGGGGVYQLQAKVAFASNATGYRQLEFRKNGSAVGTLVTQAPISGVVTVMGIHATLVLAAADYVEVFAYQNSGGSLNIGAASPRSVQNEFSVVQITKT
jgi:hypothetical protein